MATVSRKRVPGTGHWPLLRGGTFNCSFGSCEEFRGNCQPLPWHLCEPRLGGQQTSLKHSHTHLRTQSHLPLPGGLPLTNGLLQRLVGDLLGRHSLWEKGQRCTECSGRWRGGGRTWQPQLPQLPGGPFTSQKTVPMGRNSLRTPAFLPGSLVALCL